LDAKRKEEEEEEEESVEGFREEKGFQESDYDIDVERGIQCDLPEFPREDVSLTSRGHDGFAIVLKDNRCFTLDLDDYEDRLVAGEDLSCKPKLNEVAIQVNASETLETVYCNGSRRIRSILCLKRRSEKKLNVSGGKWMKKTILCRDIMGNGRAAIGFDKSSMALYNHETKKVEIYRVHGNFLELKKENTVTIPDRTAMNSLLFVEFLKEDLILCVDQYSKACVMRTKSEDVVMTTNLSENVLALCSLSAEEGTFVLTVNTRQNLVMYTTITNFLLSISIT
jgi:hypothetical protein